VGVMVGSAVMSIPPISNTFTRLVLLLVASFKNQIRLMGKTKGGVGGVAASASFLRQTFFTLLKRRASLYILPLSRRQWLDYEYAKEESDWLASVYRSAVQSFVS